MDIPRGHAMLPLNESDFLDFIYNYFKAEYAPIRSLWSTATAEPRQPQRWISMGHELVPLSFRPANAQAQKDLESLDYFTRRWRLDAGFVRGVVIRYAKYEVHERLEKKLYECCRLDLMVRKALKEKHLIDMLWPSPAPRDIAKELLAQGVQVRRWYGDMFAKYFRHLHAVDDFSLRQEVDLKIKSSNTLMLVPFVDHLVFGAVDPIMPIVSKGAGYANAKAWRQKQGDSFGDPEKFEVRFETPGDVQETDTRSVMRQCQCAKCGSKRDVEVVISIDPSPGLRSQRTVQRRQPKEQPNISAPRRQHSKASQRYAPGYSMPSTNDASPRESLPPRHEKQSASQDVRPSSPQQKKNCPRCTFLNHPDLTSCEMCQSELPKTLASSPPSPAQKKVPTPNHMHSASLPPPTARVDEVREAERPMTFNRHSLSSQLFSIFPFSQQHQTEHHAKLPPTQAVDTASAGAIPTVQPDVKVKSKGQDRPTTPEEEQQPTLSAQTSSAPSHVDPPSTPPDVKDHEPSLSNHPGMTLMPLTPPPTSNSTHRPTPVGLPQSLMEDPLPMPSPFVQDEEEDAGWGEVSKEEARRSASDDEEDDEVGMREGLVDLDEVAREEIGVWGERED